MQSAFSIFISLDSITIIYLLSAIYVMSGRESLFRSTTCLMFLAVVSHLIWISPRYIHRLLTVIFKVHIQTHSGRISAPSSFVIIKHNIVHWPLIITLIIVHLNICWSFTAPIHCLIPIPGMLFYVQHQFGPLMLGLITFNQCKHWHCGPCSTSNSSKRCWWYLVVSFPMPFLSI